MLVVFAVLTTLLLFTFSEFAPGSFSLKRLTLPVPFFPSSFHNLYKITAFLLFAILLPIAEELYFRIFQLLIWKGIVGHLFVSWSLALVFLSAFIQMAEGIEMIMSAVIGVVVFQFVLVGMKVCCGTISSMCARIGVGLGIYFWLFWLVMAFDDGEVFQQPEVFENGMRQNIFS